MALQTFNFYTILGIGSEYTYTATKYTMTSGYSLESSYDSSGTG